jgi:hypothetical protein
VKPIAAIATAMALSCNLALAGPPDGQSRGGPPVERLKSELGLDDTQVAEVQKIFAAARTRMETARKENRAQMEADLANVLSAEQMTEFKQIMSEARERRRHRGPPPSGD